MPVLDWSNLVIGVTFIFPLLVLEKLHPNLGILFLIATIRCTVQLTVAASVFQYLSTTKNTLAAAGITVLLVVFASFQTVIKIKRRFQHTILYVLFAMMASTIPVAVFGAHFMAHVVPVWTPNRFIPVMGMLCWNAIKGISVSQNYILQEFDNDRDKTGFLPFSGSLYFHGYRPLVVEALRLALNPVIEQMSVMGLFNIPNALLDGSDPIQIIKQQMVIFNMMLVSRTLSCTLVTAFTLSECVDLRHHIDNDHIDTRPHVLRRASKGVVRVTVNTVRAIIASTKRAWISLIGTANEMPPEGVTVGDGNGHGTDPRSESIPLLAA